jgi:hypothetical protein
VRPPVAQEDLVRRGDPDGQQVRRGSRVGAFPASGLRREIERHCDLTRLQDAAIPVNVVAADVLTGPS